MKKLLSLSKRKKQTHTIKLNIASAIILTVTVLCFFAACITGIYGKTVTAGGRAIYGAKGANKNVCLMFNVYENSDNVCKILTILDKYNVPATFFVGGIWAEKHCETLSKIAASDCEIGNHGYTHRSHDKLSYSQNKAEIELCNNLIKRVTGKTCRLFAPPSGAFSKATENACKDLEMSMIMWTKDTIDWRDKNASLILKRATSKPENGDFILMHPTDCTVLALPSIIEFYITNGFEIVTVSQALFANVAL